MTLGIILGGRIGYVLFYNLPHFAAHPIEILQLWNGGMSFHGGFIGCVVAVVLFARKPAFRSCRSATSPARSGRSGCSSAASPISSTANCGAARPTCPGRWCFPSGGPLPRHPSQLYEAALEGLVLLAVLALLMRAGALKRPGLIIGSFAVRLRHRAHTCEFFREPDAQLGFLWGGATMGQLLSVPLFLAGVGFIAYALKHPPLRSLSR